MDERNRKKQKKERNKKERTGQALRKGRKSESCSLHTFSTAAVRRAPTLRTSPFTFLPRTSKRFVLLIRSKRLGAASWARTRALSTGLLFFFTMAA
jgi:hypothetical protein